MCASVHKHTNKSVQHLVFATWNVPPRTHRQLVPEFFQNQIYIIWPDHSFILLSTVFCANRWSLLLSVLCSHVVPIWESQLLLEDKVSGSQNDRSTEWDENHLPNLSRSSNSHSFCHDFDVLLDFIGPRTHWTYPHASMVILRVVPWTTTKCHLEVWNALNSNMEKSCGLLLLCPFSYLFWQWTGSRVRIALAELATLEQNVEANQTRSTSEHVLCQKMWNVYSGASSQIRNWFYSHIGISNLHSPKQTNQQGCCRNVLLISNWDDWFDCKWFNYYSTSSRSGFSAGSRWCFANEKGVN